MKRTRGFTMIELLVVVGIVVILAAILVPVLGKAREASRRAVCASRLHGQSQAVAFYATRYDDHLPEFWVSQPPTALSKASTPLWWYDQSIDFTNQLFDPMQSGTPSDSEINRKLFYCPSAPDQMSAGWTLADHRTLGYAWLNDRGTGLDGIPWTPDDQGGPLQAATLDFFQSPAAKNQNLRLLQQLVSNRLPARALLAFDAIVSEYDKSPNHWQGIQASVAPGDLVGSFMHNTNHMQGSRPAGGNFLFCDGHAEWRKFPPNTADATAIPSAEPPTRGHTTYPYRPYFWVPNQ